MPRKTSSASLKEDGLFSYVGEDDLLEDEIVMCYAEDLRHCFHVFSPGRKWRGYYVLNKRASGSSFAGGLSDHARPRVKSAPMGWTNIVDFIQDGLERMGSIAGVPSQRIIKMGEPRFLAASTTPRSFFSFYVDIITISSLWLPRVSLVSTLDAHVTSS